MGKINVEMLYSTHITDVNHAHLLPSGLLQRQLIGNQKWLPDPRATILLHSLQSWRIIFLYGKKKYCQSNSDFKNSELGKIQKDTENIRSSFRK